MADPGVPDPTRPPRRESRIARWATTSWCLLAGALLSVAPHAGTVWSERFFESSPRLQSLLWTDAARFGISGFGLVLLAFGAWDVSRFVVEELA